MKKLNVPSILSNTLYEQIITNSRDSNKKIVLENIKEVIFERYTHYDTNKNKLELIIESPNFQKDEKIYLKSNYSRNKLGYLEGQIVTNILEIQTPQMKNKCPYCGIDKPRTIDHYLPQSLFPEYSVFPQNLIPCCSNCNSKKGNRWIEEGSRIFINYYYDDLPYDKVFLNANIEFTADKAVPKIKFSLLGKNISKENYELINSHFDKLGLLDEYQSIIETEVSELRDNVLNNMDLSTEQHVNNANRSLETFERLHGVNYWKAVLYRAIDEDFFNRLREQ